MSRPKNIIPSIAFKLWLPENLAGKVTIHLWSELEGRIPYGKLTEFFSARLQEFFSHEQLDLAPWTGQPPDTFIISGSPEAIELLRKTLDEDMRLG